MVTGDEFLRDIASSIPITDRAHISPVVFGGAPDEDTTVTEETEAARAWVCTELLALGFTHPALHECPTLDSSQDVTVSWKNREVTIVPRIHGIVCSTPIVIAF
jgi:hypothetical protein